MERRQILTSRGKKWGCTRAWGGKNGDELELGDDEYIGNTLVQLVSPIKTKDGPLVPVRDITMTKYCWSLPRPAAPCRTPYPLILVGISNRD
jgi:hypothetical protein